MICTLLFCVVSVFIGFSESAPVPWQNGKFPSNFPGIGKGVNPFFLYSWFKRLLKNEALNSFMNSFSRSQTQSKATPSTTPDNVSTPAESVRNGDEESTGVTLVVARDKNPAVPPMASSTTLKPLSAAIGGIPVITLNDENNGLQTDRITNDTSAGSTPAPSTETPNLKIIRDTFEEDAVPVSSGSNVQSVKTEQTTVETPSDLTIVRDTDNIDQKDDTADTEMVRDGNDNEDMTSNKKESSTKPGLLILQPRQLRGFFFKQNR